MTCPKCDDKGYVSSDPIAYCDCSASLLCTTGMGGIYAQAGMQAFESADLVVVSRRDVVAVLEAIWSMRLDPEPFHAGVNLKHQVDWEGFIPDDMPDEDHLEEAILAAAAASRFVTPDMSCQPCVKGQHDLCEQSHIGLLRAFCSCHLINKCGPVPK